jgi:hypothetical protein
MSAISTMKLLALASRLSAVPMRVNSESKGLGAERGGFVGDHRDNKAAAAAAAAVTSASMGLVEGGRRGRSRS